MPLLGGAIIAAIFYLSFSNEPGLLHVENGDKYGHFLAYFVLMGWFGLAYPSIPCCLTAAFLFSGMGVCIELLQQFTPTRAFEWLDIVASVCGVAVALTLLMIGPVVTELGPLKRRS